MTRPRKRGKRGLGAVNPDATGAIQAARQGKCKTAMRRLYDASPHVQSHTPTEKHRQDYKIAALIVAQHCGGSERPKVTKYRVGGKMKRSHYAGFAGVKSFRRVKRKRRA